jgi:diaminohydroxyphosphoribosylaminopyrimidine deaminase/5-amino-6-(5-phosphoribosylamino)uracil reductase
MHRCLQLAEAGSGYVAPNPMVGCVIVHQGRIIGEGFHTKYGSHHAEVEAIKSVKNKELLSESTLYVNLEPCSHYGKTPPCADLIIQNKIPEVVFAIEDPNPLVAGNGKRKLEENGVKVVSGILADEARELNKRFLTFQLEKRPYITLKWAQTFNGFIDDNSDVPLKITQHMTDIIMHKKRHEESAILVGYNTANKDNPKLDCRHVSDKIPTRIVIDKNNSLSADKYLLSDGNGCMVLNETESKTIGNVEYIQLNDCKNPFEIVSYLYQKNIQSVLVEGGAKTLQMFIDSNLWDEALRITNNDVIKNGVKAPQLNSGVLIQSIQSGADRISYLKNENP